MNINDLLQKNDNKAYSVEEIEEHLIDEYPELFPQKLVGEDAVTGAQSARQSIIVSVLLRMVRLERVNFRTLPEEVEDHSELYLTYCEGGFFPVAQLDELKEVDLDSPYLSLECRFRKIEDEMINNVSDIEERVAQLEHRFRQKHG